MVKKTVLPSGQVELIALRLRNLDDSVESVGNAAGEGGAQVGSNPGGGDVAG